MFNFFRKTEEKNLKEGLNLIYYKDKKTIKSEINFSNNKRHGICKFYDSSGNLILETTYVNGKKEGIQKKYFYSGSLERESNWKNDKQEGKTITYYRNGSKFREIELENEEYVSIQEFMPEGNIKFKIEGDKYIFFDHDGKVKIEAFFKIKDYEVKEYGDPFQDKNFNEIVKPFGTWKVFENNDTYEYVFDELDKVKVFKNNSDSYDVLDFVYNLDSLVMFDWRFVSDRSSLEHSDVYISYANNGIKGPPGINQSKLVDLKFVELEDLIKVNKRNKSQKNRGCLDEIKDQLIEEGGNLFHILKNFQKLVNFKRVINRDDIKSLIHEYFQDDWRKRQIDSYKLNISKIILILEKHMYKLDYDLSIKNECIKEYFEISTVCKEVLNEL